MVVYPNLLIYPLVPFPFGNHKFVFSVSLFLFYKYVHLYYIFDFTYVTSNSTCLSLSDLFHSE